jgi:hypothetical protein
MHGVHAVFFCEENPCAENPCYSSGRRSSVIVVIIIPHQRDPQTLINARPSNVQPNHDPHNLRRLHRATGPRRPAMCAVQNQVLQFDLPTRPLAPRAQADL